MVTAKQNKEIPEPDMLVLVLVTLFVHYWKPTLEYSNPIWGPSFILDQRKLEKVLQKATCLLSTIANKPFFEKD